MTHHADNEADIGTVHDRGEPISEMEPLLVEETSRHRAKLTDMAVELAQKAAGFRRSLPESLLASLANLVRAMNCYYSNLIEGHYTHPVDIERALKNDYSKESQKRDLQLEAIAHIAVQEWIDGGGLQGRATTESGIRETHKRFCELLPDDLLWVEDPEAKKRVRVVPGELRARCGGGHPRRRERGRGSPLSNTFRGRLWDSEQNEFDPRSGATAHHRLLWIHPFLDGNGRVARLMSHAMLLETLGTGGAWSVARGLARNLEAYKRHLIACDQPRRNDLDGRGQLSEEALAAFTEFFLGICIDQVDFMEGLVQPDRLRTRIRLWAEEETELGHLPPKSSNILEALLYRGELPRGDAAGVVNTGDRQARRIVSALLEHGVLASESPRASLRLAFPAALASRWMPGLFPEKEV